MRRHRVVASIVVLALLAAGGTPVLAGLRDHEQPGTLAAPVSSAASSVAGARIDDALAARLRSALSTDRLLVYVHGTDLGRARSAVRRSGLEAVSVFERIGVIAAVGTPASVRRAAARPGVTFLEDAARALTYDLDTSHVATRGREARTAFQDEVPALDGDLDGSGTTIAVIDSGIDGTHPFFQRDGASKVVRNLKLACHDGVSAGYYLTGAEDLATCARAVGGLTWLDAPGNDSDTISLGGHGTHVAGIAAGVDATLADGRQLHGAAPGADLVGLSIGLGINILAADSALEWVLDHHADPCGGGSCWPIRVVNLSIGSLGGSGYDPELVTSKLQDALVTDGVTVVRSAGNNGGEGEANAVNGPAQSPTPGVIGVANYDDGGTGTRDGQLAPTSSRGALNDPTTWPDISAPGTSILSSCRVTLPVCHVEDAPDGDDFYLLSGTSMAAPHVAGIVAQLLEADPGLTPGEIEDVLEDTAHPFTFGGAYREDPRNADSLSSFDKGHGLVDVLAATGAVLGVPVPGTPPPADPNCPADRDTTRTSFTDPAGDANLGGVGNADTSNPGLDVVATAIELTDNGYAVTVDAEDLAAAAPPGQAHQFNVALTVADAPHEIIAEVDDTGAVTYDYAAGDATASVSGTWDAAGDRVTMLVELELSPGAALGAFAVRTYGGAGLLVLHDEALGGCPVVVPGVPVPPPAHATLTAEAPSYSWEGPETTGAETFVLGPLALSGSMVDTRRIAVVAPEGGTLEATITPSPTMVLSIEIVDGDGQVLDIADVVPTQTGTVSAPVTSGTYSVIVRYLVAVDATYAATVTLV